VLVSAVCYDASQTINSAEWETEASFKFSGDLFNTQPVKAFETTQHTCSPDSKMRTGDGETTSLIRRKHVDILEVK